MERRTRIWVGLGTALLVGGSGTANAAVLRHGTGLETPALSDASALPQRPRVFIAQAQAAGEGGPGEGGGAVLGTITEFRLASQDKSAFQYDGKAQVSAYADLVLAKYKSTLDAASSLREAALALKDDHGNVSLDAARKAWLDTRAAYLQTEAFQFYAGPVDIPTVSADASGGPIARLNGWPVVPATIDAIIADANQSLNFRALARLNRVEPTVNITTGLHVIEYLLWGENGAVTAEDFAGETGARRAEYLLALTQLFTNDITALVAAWAPESNNYRASVLAMDQRNALGRAFNGMSVLLGYELPLRRIGAGLFPANENFQPSPFSATSEADNPASYAGARAVYYDAGLSELVASQVPDLAEKIDAGFARVDAAFAKFTAPYERFLAPASDSAERAEAQEAVRALTDLARDLRQAANRLGILVVIPGM